MKNTIDVGEIKIKGYDNGKKKGGISKAVLRRIVFERDRGVCQLCGYKIRANEVWDLARNRAGQPYTEKNCFVAHHDCNISQGRKTRKQALRGIGVYERTPRGRTKPRKTRGLSNNIIQTGSINVGKLEI